MRCAALLGVLSGICAAQAPKPYLEQSPPSPSTKVVKLEFTNTFDQSRGEALLELPEHVNGPAPLIVTPHGANWTQEMNRGCWTGVADKFGVMILYPVHQGMAINPRVSIGSARQMANLESAIRAVEKKYAVDPGRIYAGGISQGGLETLLLIGRNPGRFAGALSINPVVDFLAFDQGSGMDKTEPGLKQFQQTQWAVLQKVFRTDFGGTPDTARAEYYLRSPLTYAREISMTPLILYWAENDELIPGAADYQGGLLAKVIRAFNPKSFQEIKHSGGHGYPFYRVDLQKMSVTVFPRDTFLDSVTQMLSFRQTRQ